MRRVAILRPEPGATATVERARRRGLDAMATSLFEVEPLEWAAPDAASFDALLLTSANAVRHGGDKLIRLRSLPVYAVGEATAQAARDAGFEVASTGDAGADESLASLAPNLRLLHLCGEHRRIPDNAPQEITPIVVYRSRPKESVDLSGSEGSLVLIHSTRAGQRFASLVDAAGIDRRGIAIVAISPEAADAAGGGWASVQSAQAPNDDALLALAERLCNKPD
jgi:uroporphyrinogen-III synthase